MYSLNLHDLTVEQFLAEYWQKKPLLIKGGFANFVDPITPDELAGLAAEEEIESRIVSNAKGEWQLETGPFEDYNAYGEQDWTLLVQAVDHWHPAIHRAHHDFLDGGFPVRRTLRHGAGDCLSDDLGGLGGLYLGVDPSGAALGSGVAGGARAPSGPVAHSPPEDICHREDGVSRSG